MALLIVGGIAGVSWLAFCFGSIIIGVILLFVAPPILFLPFGLSVYGLMHVEAGYRNILGGKLREQTKDEIEISKVIKEDLEKQNNTSRSGSWRMEGNFICIKCKHKIHSSESAWDTLYRNDRCPACKHPC